MAGTAIEVAYDDARDQYGEALAIAGRGLNNAVQSLAWNVRIEPAEGMKPLIVFNPHAWQVKAAVEMEYGRFHDGDILIDETGCQVPMQTVQSLATAGGRYRLCVAADLPPMGYRTYRVVPGPAGAADTAASPAPVQDDVVASDQVLENRRFRLEIDPASGCIKSLRDKLAATDVFVGAAARAVVIDDPSDTWSHSVFKFDRIIGEFGAARARLVEHGPVKSVLRVTSEYGRSRLVQDFTLYRDVEQIDVHVTVDWREQFKMLKLRFPVNVWEGRATYEVPYGYIQRFPNGDEEPLQGWVDLTGVSRENDALIRVEHPQRRQVQRRCKSA